jgi:hypothetical protein
VKQPDLKIIEFQASALTDRQVFQFQGGINVGHRGDKQL